MSNRSDSITPPDPIVYYFSTYQQQLWDGTINLPSEQILSITSDNITISQLREFIFAIPDYSVNKYYKVVANGTFQEIDCIVPSGIFLDLTNAIIETDATWTDVTPVNYTFLAEANKDYSTIDRNFKHCLVIHNGGIVKGGTLDTKNTLIKYHIHDDFTTSPNGHAIYSDIKFKGTTSTGFCVGMGLRDLENRTLAFLESLDQDTKQMMFMHNTLNQNDICILEIINCIPNNRDLLSISGQGSDQVDLIIVKSETAETVKYIAGSQVAMNFQLEDTLTLTTE